MSPLRLSVCLCAVWCAVCSVLPAETAAVRRLHLPAPLKVPLRNEQAIDRAAWIWHPGADGWSNRVAAASNVSGLYDFPAGWSRPVFLRFRNVFAVTNAAARKLRFHVSADERFVLSLDGEIVARGPHRGTIDHWTFQSYETELAPGRHVFDAVVWRVGPSAPKAQLSWQGGFVFAAECDDAGLAAKLLTGGKGATWRVSDLNAKRVKCTVQGGGFVGGELNYAGACPFYGAADADETFVAPAVVRGARGLGASWGHVDPGWKLEPTTLPDSFASFRALGTAKAIRRGGADVAKEPITEQECKDADLAKWNDFFAGKTPTMVVPAHAAWTLVCDLGEYATGLPEVETGASASGSVSIGLHERGFWKNPKNADGKAKGHPHRARCAGLTFPVRSVAKYDLAPNGRHSTFWWKAGKWAVVRIAAGDAPIAFTRLGLREDRYPLENEAAFKAEGPGSEGLDGVQKICVRTMQQCAHEALMDCPFYEQQMYPGDTRVQLMILTAMTRDDRLIKRAVEIFDQSRSADGFIRMNYPCWGDQESASYSLCWLLMLGDYAAWHADAAWLRARVPGMRHTLAQFEQWEDKDGLLGVMPYWNFMDWAGEGTEGTEWKLPAAETHVACLMDLFHLLALESCAGVERALGDEDAARRLEKKVARKRAAVLAAYWDEKRGLLRSVRAGAPNHDDASFTEHAQALGILGGVFDDAKTKRVMEAIAMDDAALKTAKGVRLARCSVYFSHYLFEAFKKIGRADLTLKRFDLWRGYVAQGLTTCLESPWVEARSDCHAWGSHPLYQMQSALAGVEPAAPFFKRVRIAPQPATLTHVAAKTPHPAGWIETDLAFGADGSVRGTATLPAGVDGEFVWKGKTQPLKPGKNAVAMRAD